MTKRVTEEGEEIITLYICEATHLMFRPNRLYFFEVDHTCEKCKELAAVYDKEN